MPCGLIWLIDVFCLIYTEILKNRLGYLCIRIGRARLQIWISGLSRKVKNSTNVEFVFLLAAWL